MRSYLLLLLLLLLLQIGCSSSEEEPGTTATDTQETNQRDEALATLAALNQDTMREAFARLSDFSYTTRTRTEQCDEQGQVLAISATTARHFGADSISVLNTNTTGRFAFGWMERFTEDPTRTIDLAPFPTHILPEDPPYLSPRNREAYNYTFLPDTMLADQSVHVIEVQARPDSDQEQTIQRGRFYIHPDDETLLGLELERLEQGLLFREESRYAITLHPAPDGSGWLPASTEADVHLDAPFRPPEQFSTTRLFSDFDILPALKREDSRLDGTARKTVTGSGSYAPSASNHGLPDR